LFFWLVIGFAGSTHLVTLADQDFLLPALNTDAQKCFLLEEILACETALILTDDLQRKAGEVQNYSCQTLALGLGSDLILTRLEGGRGEEAFEILREVNMTCRNL